MDPHEQLGRHPCPVSECAYTADVLTLVEHCKDFHGIPLTGTVKLLRERNDPMGAEEILAFLHANEKINGMTTAEQSVARGREYYQAEMERKNYHDSMARARRDDERRKLPKTHAMYLSPIDHRANTGHEGIGGVPQYGIGARHGIGGTPHYRPGVGLSYVSEPAGNIGRNGNLPHELYTPTDVHTSSPPWLKRGPDGNTMVSPSNNGTPGYTTNWPNSYVTPPAPGAVTFAQDGGLNFAFQHGEDNRGRRASGNPAGYAGVAANGTPYGVSGFSPKDTAAATAPGFGNYHGAACGGTVYGAAAPGMGNYDGAAYGGNVYGAAAPGFGNYDGAAYGGNVYGARANREMDYGGAVGGGTTTANGGGGTFAGPGTVYRYPPDGGGEPKGKTPTEKKGYRKGRSKKVNVRTVEEGMDELSVSVVVLDEDEHKGRGREQGRRHSRSSDGKGRKERSRDRQREERKRSHGRSRSRDRQLSSSSSEDTSTEEENKGMDYKEKFADYRIARSGGRDKLDGAKLPFKDVIRKKKDDIMHWLRNMKPGYGQMSAKKWGEFCADNGDRSRAPTKVLCQRLVRNIYHRVYKKCYDLG
jgi:hypothetical protein